MIRQLVNATIRRLGLKLVKTVPVTRPPYPPTEMERDEINAILYEFIKSQNSSSSPEEMLQRWQAYLDDARISFFEEIVRLLSDKDIVLSDKDIADFGSGTGYLLRRIKRIAPSSRLRGYDSYAAFNSLAEKICPAAQFSENFDADHHVFDIIFCTEVLEHLKFPASMIDRLLARLRTHGLLVVTVPDGRKDTQDARKEREDRTGYWGHIHFWSPESWPLFLQNALHEKAEFESGVLETGANFAVIRKLT